MGKVGSLLVVAAAAAARDVWIIELSNAGVTSMYAK